MIKAWIFEFFPELFDPAAQRDPQAVQAHFQESLQLWVDAEARGFDGIFFSEHHFGGAYSPSPNLLIAALAARTSRLRLGVLGTVTPYATPWRVVEEFAMLDHLTGGRLEPGVVSGIPPEMAAAGIGPTEAAERHDEIVSVLIEALSGAPVTHHGNHFRFDSLRLIPPFLQPGLKVWTAVRSEASAAKAGARGLKVCGGFVGVAQLASMMDAYRDAMGTDDPDNIGVRRFVTFAPSREQGVALGRQILLAALRASAGPLPPFAQVLDRPNATAADREAAGLSDDEFVSGSPSEVAEQLVEQCRAIGAGHVVVSLGSIGHEAKVADQETFAREVLPVLRSASIR